MKRRAGRGPGRGRGGGVQFWTKGQKKKVRSKGVVGSGRKQGVGGTPTGKKENVNKDPGETPTPGPPPMRNVRRKHILFLRKHIRDISWNSSLPLLLLVTKLPPQAKSPLFCGAQVRGRCRKKNRK